MSKLKDAGLLNAHPIAFQTNELLQIASNINGQNYDGLIDHGGQEILFMEPATVLNVVEINELPETREQWDAAN